MKKFPFYKQHDSRDCGPACLRMIAQFYGKTYSQQFLHERCRISKAGVSMLGISDAAESIGFRTKGLKITWEQFHDEMPLPCIVYWRKNHFIIVYDIKKNGTVKIADPAHGLIEYSTEEFKKYWISTTDGIHNYGIALMLETTAQFHAQEGEQKQKIRFAYLLNYLYSYKRYIVQIFLAMIIGSIISLIFPFLTQSVVDYGINNNNLNFVLMILVAQVALTFGQTANDLISSWLMLHVTTRVSISFISDFLGKLMRLPISFFDSKHVGDIMQRIGDNSRIQSFLTGSLLSIAVAIISFIVYSGIMAAYDLTILGVFMLGSLFYVLWIIFFLKYRRKLDYKRFQESASNQSNLVQLVTGMQEIKLNNCEKQKRWEWERIQARLYKVSIKSMTLNQTQQVGGLFIDQAKNVLISYLAARAVIEGNMTLGMMMAMQYILGQLSAPIMQFISFTQAAQDAKISLERLGEIYDKEDEEPVDSHKIKEIPQSANIVFKDVTFAYNSAETVLDNINLTIPAGKITAVVGVSGSGKTTLLKLLLGFYQPQKGEIYLGDKSLPLYSDKCWRRCCGVVMQEGFIFSDTIASNIGIVDEEPDHERVVNASRVANISEFIESLPLRYDTEIGPEGNGLSSGQKQRLLIARAVYKEPEYIIFDEATNSLDVSNEKTIMQNMKRFFTGKTVIIVAHRLSTVRNADQIVVLDKGTIAEVGTHEELVTQHSLYYNLVKDQLELGN